MQVESSDSEPAARRATAIRDAMPEGGLFANQTWRTAVAPFALGEKLAKELDSLGRVLLQFYRAGNLLHRQSTEGKQPAWISRWLDQGKPPELLQLQQSSAFRNELPRVIRPDILLTDEGFSITELDSVPGGIGLTAWLNQTYGKANSGNQKAEIIGGDNGMLDGFASIFGVSKQVHIVVSEEAASYRPEMRWLSEQLNRRSGAKFNLQPETFTCFSPGDAVYRFFELFDLPNVPSSACIFEMAEAGKLSVTPPPKPCLEEKMMLALLWNRNLAEFWHQQLGAGFFQRLKQHFPYSWVVDPAPLPPQGAIPELNLTDWQQLKTMSQRERNLILKISGYSERAWGARGVYLGSDLSHPDWAAAVEDALRSFPTSPFVLQRYHKPQTIEVQWFDFETGLVRNMPGRVRLCPYYFVAGEGSAARTHLGGVLATIVPADKKIVHGMADAVIAPCSIY